MSTYIRFCLHLIDTHSCQVGSVNYAYLNSTSIYGVKFNYKLLQNKRQQKHAIYTTKIRENRRYLGHNNLINIDVLLNSTHAIIYECS